MSECFRREVKQFERCVPISQPCFPKDPPFETIFAAVPQANGINVFFTITNTSACCHMNIRINNAIPQTPSPAFIHPGDSTTFHASNVRSIEISCLGPCNETCTGTFHGNFFFSVPI